MNRRSRWVCLAGLLGIFLLANAGREAVVAQGQPDRRPGEFVQAGRFTINKSRIDYVERSERGQLYVYFTSKNSIVLAGDAAQSLLRAMGAEN